MIAVLALMIQSYLATEDDIKLLNANLEFFQWLVCVLRDAIEAKSQLHVKFAAIELIEVYVHVSKYGTRNSRFLILQDDTVH